MPTRCNHPGLLEQVEKIVTNNLDPRFTRELERLLNEHRSGPTRANGLTTRAMPATGKKPGSSWTAVLEKVMRNFGTQGAAK